VVRPQKQRCINCQPVAYYFKPCGTPLQCLTEIGLEIDELEAIRLADLDGLYQADVAVRMGISRQTVGNILARAHRKIADALLNGKALRIASPLPHHPDLEEETP
jgi:predicted DNA-binding protein (UPF0251 family)